MFPLLLKFPAEIYANDICQLLGKGKNTGVCVGAEQCREKQFMPSRKLCVDLNNRVSALECPRQVPGQVLHVVGVPLAVSGKVAVLPRVGAPSDRELTTK